MWSGCKKKVFSSDHFVGNFELDFMFGVERLEIKIICFCKPNTPSILKKNEATK